jgi:hypothetical protein
MGRLYPTYLNGMCLVVTVFLTIIPLNISFKHDSRRIKLTILSQSLIFRCHQSTWHPISLKSSYLKQNYISVLLEIIKFMLLTRNHWVHKIYRYNKQKWPNRYIMHTLSSGVRSSDIFIIRLQIIICLCFSLTCTEFAALVSMYKIKVFGLPVTCKLYTFSPPLSLNYINWEGKIESTIMCEFAICNVIKNWNYCY